MMSITLDDALIAGIEQFIAAHDEPPHATMSHADAVNVIVRDWLMGQGYLEIPGDPDPIVPAVEAARIPEA